MNLENNINDNLVSNLSRVFIEKRHSTAKNKDYAVLVLTWLLPNGKTFKQEQFVSNEQLALIEMSVQQPMTQGSL